MLPGLLSPPCPPSLSSISCDSISLLLPDSINSTYYIFWQRSLLHWSTSTVPYNRMYFNTTQVIIGGLLPTTVYQFRVILSTDFGNTTLSNPLTVSTTETSNVINIVTL